MQHSPSPTFTFKPLILLLPLLPHHRLLLLAVLLRPLLPLSPPDLFRFLQWNGGGLQARSTELLHFLSSHPVDLICIQESNLNSTSLFRIRGFSTLRYDRPTPGLAFSFMIPRALAALSFSSDRAYSSLNFLPPLSPRLTTFLIYAGANISLNDSSLSLSLFLMFTLPLFVLLRQMGKPTPFLSPFFPLPEISSFWGTLIAITPSSTLRDTSNFCGEEVFD